MKKLLTIVSTAAALLFSSTVVANESNTVTLEYSPYVWDRVSNQRLSNFVGLQFGHQHENLLFELKANITDFAGRGTGSAEEIEGRVSYLMPITRRTTVWTRTGIGRNSVYQPQFSEDTTFVTLAGGVESKLRSEKVSLFANLEQRYSIDRNFPDYLTSNIGLKYHATKSDSFAFSYARTYGDVKHNSPRFFYIRSF